MSSISDIFSPTFLIFLGILVLVVSLLVVYFEGKMRDQNHKISTMLSLVSTLAEDVNNVKYGLNHLAINSRPLEESNKFVNIPTQNNLITVSDDEDSDEDSDIEEDSNENYDLELDLEETNDLELEENSEEEIDDSDSETDSDDENFEEVKVLKINIPSDNDSLSSQINLDINNDLTELDDNFSDNESETDENNLEEDITLEEVPNNLEDNLKIDLKKISINLEEPHNLTMDYKKLSLTKLRSVVSEKSLSNDASKLKKNELLKLLGVE
jgi:hypothetical protein